jgi:hypothetical protein
LYTYLPLSPSNSTRLLAVPPFSRMNGDSGFSVGRGAFKLDVAVGRWVSVAIRAKLNTPGEEDGWFLPSNPEPFLLILPIQEKSRSGWMASPSLRSLA